MNKNPREKKEYTIGIMTGVHRECSEGIVDAIIEVFREKDLDVHFVLFQGIDTRRYLDLDPNSQGIIDSHYFSVYEYGKFIELDLIIAAFGTVIEGPKRMSAEEFFAPFKDIPVILLETLETIDECESTRNGRVMEPPLTAVEQDFSPLANQVRESAISLIQGEQANVVTLPAELIVRGSCGCKAKEVATKKDEGPIDMSVAEDHERCSIATSLILRGIDDTELDPKSCYLRLADSLKSIGATFICICTLDEPYTVSSEDKFFLPETLNVDLILEDGEIETYLDNEKGMDEVAPALSLRRHKDKHLAVLEDVIQEIEADRGSRYAPYVVDLLSEESVVEELRGILKNNRAENYKKVYRRIKNSDTKYKQEGLLPRVAKKE